MKIAFVIQDLFGRGAEYATALLVRGFVEKGYDVDLIVSRIHSDKLANGLKPFEIPVAVKVIYLTNRKARYNILQLRRYLKTTDAVAVVQMGGGYERAVALASLGLRHCPRLYAVRHTIDFALTDKLAYRKSNNGWLSRLYWWWHYRPYDGVLCVAEKVRQETIRLHHLAPERVHTVYNPSVDSVFFSKLKGPATHPWLLRRQCPVFVVAGSFSPEKNHMMVMDAIRIVNQKAKARLIVFGRGPMQAEYESFIHQNGLQDVISLPGFSCNLPAEIAISDGYISSSLIESFGIAIVEGLACGVPVISTDAPCGPREILGGGRYGELVHPNDVNGMADAIIRLMRRGRGMHDDESWRRFELSRIVDLYIQTMGIA